MYRWTGGPLNLKLQYTICEHFQSHKNTSAAPTLLAVVTILTCLSAYTGTKSGLTCLRYVYNEMKSNLTCLMQVKSVTRFCFNRSRMTLATVSIFSVNFSVNTTTNAWKKKKSYLVLNCNSDWSCLHTHFYRQIFSTRAVYIITMQKKYNNFKWTCVQLKYHFDTINQASPTKSCTSCKPKHYMIQTKQDKRNTFLIRQYKTTRTFFMQTSFSSRVTVFRYFTAQWQVFVYSLMRG